MLNKKERSALRLYDRNKLLTDAEISDMSMDEIRLRAKQQDVLYKKAFSRVDKEILRKKSEE